MSRYRNRVVLFIAAAAAITIVALIVLRSGSVDEATATTIQHRMCNVVVQASTDSGIRVFNELIDPVSGGLAKQPHMQVSLVSVEAPQAKIDTSGRVVYRKDLLGVLDTVLSTVTLSPLEPTTWPYSEDSQLPANRFDRSRPGYRYPDPSSGLVVATTHFDSLDGSLLPTSVTLVGCRSIKEVTADGVLRDAVHPLDRAAFDTFFSEVDW